MRLKGVMAFDINPSPTFPKIVKKVESIKTPTKRITEAMSPIIASKIKPFLLPIIYAKIGITKTPATEPIQKAD